MYICLLLGITEVRNHIILVWDYSQKTYFLLRHLPNMMTVMLSLVSIPQSSNKYEHIGKFFDKSSALVFRRFVEQEVLMMLKLTGPP